MKTLKRLALRALLSKEQRAVILNSVAYSEHKYRVHGDVDGAINVLAKAMKKLPSDERLQNASDALKNKKKIKMQAYNTLWLQLHLAKMPEGVKQYQTLIGRQKMTRR